jgi:catechol 2,3-dioxygenase-like lactoylglutathione lyase family enzyme
VKAGGGRRRARPAIRPTGPARQEPIVVSVTRIVPILKVTDIRAALAFYCSVLGFREDFHYSNAPGGPDYVGVSRDGHQLHLSTFAGDGVRGTAAYLYVDDVDALYADFRARGLARADLEPTNQTWGMREVYVRDADSNALRFGSPVPRAG